MIGRKKGLTYKKGQIGAVANLIFVLFGLAIMFIIVAIMFDQINTGWQADIDNDLSKEIMGSNEGKFVSIADNGFVIILVGLVLAGLASLFVLDSHPIMFIVTAIGIIILLLVAAMMSNSFSDVTDSGLINQQLNEFTFIPLIMSNFFLTVTVIAGIFTIAFFAKLRLSA